MIIILFHFIIDNPIIPITMNYDGSFYLIRQMEYVYQYLCTNLSGNRGLCVLNLFLFLLNIGFVITCHVHD